MEKPLPWKMGRFLKDYLYKYLMGINFAVKHGYGFTSSLSAHSVWPTDPDIQAAPSHRGHHTIFSACLCWEVCIEPLPHFGPVSCPMMSQLTPTVSLFCDCDWSWSAFCLYPGLTWGRCPGVPSPCFIISEVFHIPTTL